MRTVSSEMGKEDSGSKQIETKEEKNRVVEIYNRIRTEIEFRALDGSSVTDQEPELSFSKITLQEGQNEWMLSSQQIELQHEH